MSALTFPDIILLMVPNFQTLILLIPKLIATFNKVAMTATRTKKDAILRTPLQDLLCRVALTTSLVQIAFAGTRFAEVPRCLEGEVRCRLDTIDSTAVPELKIE